jgi:hypothetical protein
MKMRMMFAALLLAGLFVLPSIAQEATDSQPQICVDQMDRDYSPEEPVGILGSGFTPNSPVSVTVEGINGTEGSWSILDPSGSCIMTDGSVAASTN